MHRLPLALSACVALAVNIQACHQTYVTPSRPTVHEDERPPARRRLDELLATLSTGDRLGMRRYLVANTEGDEPHDIDEDGRILRHVFERTGGLTIVDAEPQGPTHVRARLKPAKAGRNAIVNLEVAPAPPHGVVYFSIVADRGEDRALFTDVPKGAPLAARLVAIEQEAARAAKDDLFSGVLMIAKSGTPVVARAYGLANQEKNIPNRIDTRFNAASMGKMFTGVANAQLIEQGKIRGDDNFGNFLPRYPERTVSSRVTIHQLLTHTSGLGDFLGPAFDATKGTIHTLEAYFPLSAKAPLLFEPGESWAYSNAGLVAAHVALAGRRAARRPRRGRAPDAARAGRRRARGGPVAAARPGAVARRGVRRAGDADLAPPRLRGLASRRRAAAGDPRGGRGPAGGRRRPRAGAASGVARFAIIAGGRRTHKSGYDRNNLARDRVRRAPPADASRRPPRRPPAATAPRDVAPPLERRPRLP